MITRRLLCQHTWRRRACHSVINLRYMSRAKEWSPPVGHDTGIVVHNSLTKKKEPLILPNKNYLSWYTCGPTVYSSSHIGHATTYMRFDVIRRILTNFFDINVTYQMGITDIDDKIIAKCIEVDEDMSALTSHFENEFLEELGQMNILMPTIVTRVTDNIPNIIQFIKVIIDNGCAYVGSDGSVYFDVLKYGLDKYGVFRMLQEINEDRWGVKRSEADFALWKAVKPGEPFWDSPWGHGRPGWHIECSAMASRVFGQNLDFHSGGDDLIFPHHENEIAQCHAYFGCEQWGNYWIHSGRVMAENKMEKMSKSLKNTILTKDLLTRCTPNQFRMLCLLTNTERYLSDFEGCLDRATAMDKQIGNFLRLCNSYIKGQFQGGPISESEVMEKLHKTEEKFFAALRNNFSTTQAMRSLFYLIDDVSHMLTQTSDSSTEARSPGTISAVQLYVKRVCRKLGFHKKGWKSKANVGDGIMLGKAMDNMLEYRSSVRKFAMSPPSLEIPDTPMTEKQKKKLMTGMVSPLWTASDTFREKMFSGCGMEIRDGDDHSSWDFTDKKIKTE